MAEHCPALLTTAKQLIAPIRDPQTLNAYDYADVTLYGTGINDELAINDPANANNVLQASRDACRFIGVSLTFNPQQVIPQGTMVEAAQLPAASQLRIYFHAPQNAGGGLLNAITKDMLLNHTTDIFWLGGVPTFLAVKHGQIPTKDVYDAWIEDQCNQAYFATMKQIAQKIYIGEEVATDTLRQRFSS